MIFNFLKKDSSSNPELRALLRENLIGTPGKSLVYQHQQVDEKLDHLTGSHFVSVGLRNVLIGTCCFCQRKVYLKGRPVQAYYIRYFTFRDRFRSSPASNKDRQTRIKSEVKDLLEGRLFGDSGPHIYYAYIDPNNERSIGLVTRFGFEKVGIFNTVFFSRFFPKRSDRVSKATESEQKTVIDLLKKTYVDHNFLSFENLFYRGNYFVCKKEGEIVAGIQAAPEYWKVLEMPGANGKLLLNIISKIPFLNRLFQKNFHFLSIEGIYCKKGKEHYLQVLMEDVLARMGIYTAVLCLDPDSAVYRSVQKINRGFMPKISKERSFVVVAKSVETSLPDSGNSYVSAFDVM